MSELTSEGFASCYRALEILSGAMSEWVGVCGQATARLHLGDATVVFVQRVGPDTEVFFFEDAVAFQAWRNVIAGGDADRHFRYVRVSPALDDEAGPVALESYEAYGRPMPVDDAMARRVEWACREVAAALRSSLRYAA